MGILYFTGPEGGPQFPIIALAAKTPQRVVMTIELVGDETGSQRALRGAVQLHDPRTTARFLANCA
jgi:hypothetical protein